MRKSTEQEIKRVDDLVHSTKEKIETLLDKGKKVHIIWDFDGVITDSRSDDVFTLSGYDLETYFSHEHRLILCAPRPGPWFLNLAHNKNMERYIANGQFTFDITTARSSFLSMRIHIFCANWNFYPRWILMVGHQSKSGSYRIILESFKKDPDVHIFCVDDSKKHITTFKDVAKEIRMKKRTHGIISPVIRPWNESELQEYLNRIMNVKGKIVKVRDTADDFKKFTVLPEGLKQFQEILVELGMEKNTEAEHEELKKSFVKKFGKPGEDKSFFKTEEEMEEAMKDFISSLHIP